MTKQATQMHESGHMMIKVLTGLCGFMTTVMTAGILWGASTLNGVQMSIVALQEQVKGANQQVEYLRAEMRDAGSKGYTQEAAANDRKMMELQLQILSGRVAVLEGRKAEAVKVPR